jgi:hypothetical protein
MERHQLKYGTDFTSVKVKQEPGGNSSINLAWGGPGRAQKPQAARDEVYREADAGYNAGPRYNPSKYAANPYDDETSGAYNPRSKPGRAADPEPYDDYSQGYGNSASRNKPAYGRNKYEDDYRQNEDDRYGRNEEGYERERYQDYGRGNHEENYARGENWKNTEGSGRGNETYGRNVEGYSRNNAEGYGKSGQRYGKGNERAGNSGEEYGRNYETYGRNEEGYGNKRSNYDEEECQGRSRNNEYERSERKGGRGRGQEYEGRNDYGQKRDEGYYAYQVSDSGKPKTSVKVKNPPGGQSHFTFG